MIFIPFIGNCPLFDWDEVNFAECAREMVVSGNYSRVQLNFQPFWEKPPFFIWLQAISMNIFGVNEFAARFPNAICSIISFITIFLIGKKFHSVKFGLLWCLIYASLILPHLYFKSGIIDPWFNLFIFLSVYQFILFVNNPSGKKEMFSALLAGVFLGLAVLTKGPAALVIVALTVIFTSVSNKSYRLISSKSFLIFTVTTLLVSLSWFLIELLKGNVEVIKEFINYQIRLFQTGDSGHDGPFYYHVLVLLVGCFPASFIFIKGYLFKTELTPFQFIFRKVFVILFWVVLILFSVVKTKIVHYSSLCYFPLTFLTALILIQYFNQLRFGLIFKVFYWIVSSVIALAFILVAFINHYKTFLINSGWIKDSFAVENLKANVSWSGFEFLIGIVFLAAAFLVFFGLTKTKLKLVYYGLAVNLVFIYLAILIIIPKVELYTQHSAIVFYKAIATKNCYVETHSFRSYAYLFYSNRQPQDYRNPDQIRVIKGISAEAEKTGYTPLSFYANANCYWLKNEKIDRPAYMVAKKNLEGEMLALPKFTKLYEQNGYCFFVRMPQNTP